MRYQIITQSVMAVAITCLAADRILDRLYPPAVLYSRDIAPVSQSKVSLPLDAPSMSEAETRTWAVKAVIDTYSRDFAHSLDQTSRAAEYFTISGWNSFGATLINSERMTRGRPLVSAAPERAPVLFSRSVIDGRLAYTIELPVIVSYETQSTAETVHLRVTVRVIRDAETVHPGGMAIDQIKASDA